MHVHLVFVAKYRRRVFDGPAIDALRGLFAKVCADFHRAPVHRAAADTTLNDKDGYAIRAILPRPERRGLSRTGSIKPIPTELFHRMLHIMLDIHHAAHTLSISSRSASARVTTLCCVHAPIRFGACMAGLSSGYENWRFSTVRLSSSTRRVKPSC